MTRVARWSVAVGVTLLVVVGWQSTALVQEPKDSKSNSAMDVMVESELTIRRLNDELDSKLGMPVEALFMETALDDAVKLIAEISKAPLRLDKEALNEAGIGSDSSVTLNIAGKPLSQVLDRLTRPLSLSWLVERGEVLITTQEKLKDMLSTRVYRIGSLVRLIAQREAQAKKAVPNLGNPPGGGGFGFGMPREQGHFANGNTIENSTEDRVKQFIQETTLGPWMDIDGEGSTISVARDQLVIRHSYRGHHEVAALLRTVEQALSRPAATAAITVTRSPTEAKDVVRLRELLSKEVELELIETQLKDAAAVLAEKTGEGFFLDLSDESESALLSKQEVNLPSGKRTLTSALRMILTPRKLTYTIQDGGIAIIPNSDFSEHRFTTLLYDISDFAGTDEDRQSLMRTIEESSSGPWQNSAGEGGTITELAAGLIAIRHLETVQSEIGLLLHDLRQAQKESAKEPAKPNPNALETRFVRAKSKDEAEAIEHLILTFVAPSSWDSAGGNGMIRTAEDRLIIHQTKAIHEQIDQFLREYQQAKPVGTVEAKK